jgi:hypothetical protein
MKKSLATAFWKFCHGSKRACDFDQIFVMDEALDMVKSGCVVVKDEQEEIGAMIETCRELLMHLKNLGLEVTAIGMAGNTFIAYVADKRCLTRKDKPKTFLGNKVEYRYLGSIRLGGN